MSAGLIMHYRQAVAAGNAVDVSYWKSRLRRRAEALEEDEPVFGLTPAEQTELYDIRKIVGKK